jgi:hypothetical protein
MFPNLLAKFNLYRYNEVLTLVEQGVACRKTSKTDSNNASSRSHSIFQIVLRPVTAAAAAAAAADGLTAPPGGLGLGESSSPVWAKLSLVDLAGSERGADRGKLVDQKIRQEGAEINKVGGWIPLFTSLFCSQNINTVQLMTIGVVM